MTVILFDTEKRDRLYPFTEIRPVADIRIGIFTIREWWSHHFKQDMMVSTVAYLQSDELPSAGDMLFINSSLLPEQIVLSAIASLKEGETLVGDGRIIASRDADIRPLLFKENFHPADLKLVKFDRKVSFLEYPWQIFEHNHSLIIAHFQEIVNGRKSFSVPPTNHTIAPDRIFLEEGVKMEHCILNASEGPIYLGKNTEVMEGSIIRGPFALCEGAVVKMGSKIYGGTTIGPWSVVGGEVKNTIIFGYSNKAHDGYLGNAVIGEWCNLGAGTSASNVKNSAGEIMVWNRPSDGYISSGAKCGVLMGDYSRSAINMSFNTGTVVGICASIFKTGLSPKHIRNFDWGGENNVHYKFEKAVRDISNWKKLKNQSFTDAEVRQLKHIFDKEFGD